MYSPMVSRLADDPILKDLRPFLERAVDKVMTANAKRMALRSVEHPDISSECRLFREKLREKGFEAPSADLELYQQIIRPLFHLLVRRGA